MKNSTNSNDMKKWKDWFILIVIIVVALAALALVGRKIKEQRDVETLQQEISRQFTQIGYAYSKEVNIGTLYRDEETGNVYLLRNGAFTFLEPKPPAPL